MKKKVIAGLLQRLFGGQPKQSNGEVRPRLDFEDEGAVLEEELDDLNLRIQNLPQRRN